MKWNSVCFDLDNTLFSHEQAFKLAIEQCFHELMNGISHVKNVSFDEFFPLFKHNSDRYWESFEKREVSPKEYRRLRFLETVKELELPFTEIDADWFHERYYAIVDDYSIPYEGLESLLSFLRKHKMKIGIITNGTADTQYNKLQKLGIAKWVSDHQMIVSEEVDVAKPDKRIFMLAKERFGLQEPVLFVGDSWKHDVIGAIEAGWDSIFLNSRGEKRTTEHSPVAECNTLLQVKQVIEKEVGE
ncbi:MULTISPECIES: HAD family hydrolase [Alteribacter]|uniref:HAD family hydrolase n=1 Tax=Alteribacter keqinensis TaxID=2483800 RepID=A0A3M7TTT0_9BACI|nr:MULTISPECIES: HAD family hydrolase [Alteribacter]MBM7097340.1 HAD family hydrolase [Alteribacter salitolerans]RNA68927.1 HAD family hydrolase [Alteribacter keqinensis]